MVLRPSEHRHPLSSFILLIAIALAGIFISTFLALFIGYLMHGAQILSFVESGTTPLSFQRMLVAFNSVGTFVLPPLIFARLESTQPFAYLKSNIPKPWLLLVLALAIMLCVTPFIEWTVFVNQQMKLPAFLQSIENWIKYKELQAEIMTKELLVMKSIPDLLLNLLIIAVIPAIGEEFIFRGCFQKIFTKWTNNLHAGIWIAAIIFSAIHFQFYGFIPRMALGVLFGYMLLYSNSIWIPILAHFYNNASAVIAAYVMQQKGESLNSLTKPEFQQWYLVILSIIFTALLFTVFQRIALTKNINYD